MCKYMYYCNMYKYACDMYVCRLCTYECLHLCMYVCIFVLTRVYVCVYVRMDSYITPVLAQIQSCMKYTVSKIPTKKLKNYKNRKTLMP